MRKRISIIVVTHNSKELFPQCMAHLNSSAYKEEVIVVDNASDYSDLIKQSCAAYDFRYIRSEKNLPFSKANELAINESKAQWFLLLNDDTIPNQDGWIDKMFSFARKHPKAAVIGCKLLYPQNHTIQHAGVVFNQDRQPFHHLCGTEENDPRVCEAKQFQAVTFGCAMIKRSVYDKVGGFTHKGDEWGYHYEDIDFCFKARQARGEVWYNPDVKVLHYSAASFTKMMKGKNIKTKEQYDAVIFKYLPALKKKWFIEIENDDWEQYDLPPHNPIIAIGIPLSDGSKWRFRQLMNMIEGLDYWKKRIKIIFGTNNCSQEFFDEIKTWSVLNFKKYADILMPANRTYTNDGKVKNVIVNRNLIREKAIEIKADYVFYLDSDVAFEKQTLTKLVKMCELGGSDISAGVYFYKVEDKPKPMLFETILPTEQYKEMGLKKQIKISSCREDKVIALGNFKLAKNLMDGGIHDAGACHMGCTLIKRKCLEAIPFEYKETYGTEDLSWFAKAQEKGFKLKVDTGMKLFHLDANGYVYCWWNMPLNDGRNVYEQIPSKASVN